MSVVDVVHKTALRPAQPSVQTNNWTPHQLICRPNFCHCLILTSPFGIIRSLVYYVK